MVTRRRAGGAVLAAVGALIATAGAYLDWFADLPATDLPLERLYQSDVVGQASSYWNSMALPLAAVGALGVLGALLSSRFVLLLGWLVGIVAIAAWAVMQAGDESIEAGVDSIQAGYWVSAAGLLLMLIGIVTMGRGRARHRHRED